MHLSAATIPPPSTPGEGCAPPDGGLTPPEDDGSQMNATRKTGMTQAPPLSTRPPQEPRAQSFLVRVWTESQPAGDGSPRRAYVRDLRTGEESYAKDSAELAARLGWRTAGTALDGAAEPAPRNDSPEGVIS